MYTLNRKTLVALFLCVAFNFLHADNFNFSPSEDDVCTLSPVIECPPFVWLKPIESDHPDRTGYPVAYPGAPDCDQPIVTFIDDVHIINSCHLIITRIWKAQDPNNPDLFDTCHQTIKQVDEEAPVINNPPEDIMIYTNRFDCAQMVFWDQPEIYDNSTLDYVEYTAEINGQTEVVNIGDFFPEGITEVTLTAFDFCGNFTVVKFSINIMCAQCHVDCPDDACLPVGSDISPDALGYATSFSGNVNCGAAAFDFTDIVMETGCNGKMKYMRVWEAEFETMPGFKYTCAQTIELKDDSEITLYGCPADLVIPNNFTPAHWETPLATNGNQLVMLTSNFEPGQTFPVGITTVIYTAYDLCGNEETCSFKISVLEDVSFDNCPDDIYTSCGPDGTVQVDWNPPVYDRTCSSCASSSTLSGFIYIGSLNGSSYYCSAHFYTFEQAQDKAKKLGGHIVTINSEEENQFVADHIGTSTAMIGLSDYRSEGNFVWETNEPLSYTNWFGVNPNDRDGIQDYVEILKSSGEWNDYDNGLSKEFVLERPCEYVTQIAGPAPGSDLSPGTYTVVYKISDNCGFEEYCEFNIVVEGGIKLDSCPDEIFVEGSSSESGVSVYWEAPQFSTCCDNCSGYCIDLTQAGPQPGHIFPNDSRSLINYTAQDQCGNSISCSFYVNVSAPPSNIVVNEKENRSGSAEPMENLDLHQRGLEESNDFRVFPNPTRNKVVIALENPNTVKSISIMTIDGKIVQTMSSDIKRENLMDVSSFTNGMYMIRAELSTGEIQIERLIKF